MSKLNEHLWSGIIHRSGTGNIRKEDGVVVDKTAEGKKLFISNENYNAGELVEVKGKKLLYLYDLNIYFCIVKTENNGDIYYKWDNDFKDNRMLKWFEVDEHEWSKKLIDTNFAPFASMIRTSLSLDASDFDNMYYAYFTYNDSFTFRLKNLNDTYYVFNKENQDEIIRHARSCLREIIRRELTESDFIKWIDKLDNIDKFINILQIIHENMNSEFDRDEVKLSDKEIVKWYVNLFGFDNAVKYNYLDTEKFMDELVDKFDLKELFVVSTKFYMEIENVRKQEYYVFWNHN